MLDSPLADRLWRRIALTGQPLEQQAEGVERKRRGLGWQASERLTVRRDERLRLVAVHIRGPVAGVERAIELGHLRRGDIPPRVRAE